MCVRQPNRLTSVCLHKFGITKVKNISKQMQFLGEFLCPKMVSNLLAGQLLKKSTFESVSDQQKTAFFYLNRVQSIGPGPEQSWTRIRVGSGYPVDPYLNLLYTIHIDSQFTVLSRYEIL